MPIIKRGLAFFVRQALKTGLELANDVTDGDSATLHNDIFPRVKSASHQQQILVSSREAVETDISVRKANLLQAKIKRVAMTT